MDSITEANSYLPSSEQSPQSQAPSPIGNAANFVTSSTENNNSPDLQYI